MSRQSFLVMHLVFRKFEKSARHRFSPRPPRQVSLWDPWGVDMWREQHRYANFRALIY